MLCVSMWATIYSLGHWQTLSVLDKVFGPVLVVNGVLAAMLGMVLPWRDFPSIRRYVTTILPLLNRIIKANQWFLSSAIVVTYILLFVLLIAAGRNLLFTSLGVCAGEPECSNAYYYVAYVLFLLIVARWGYWLLYPYYLLDHKIVDVKAALRKVEKRVQLTVRKLVYWLSALVYALVNVDGFSGYRLLPAVELGYLADVASEVLLTFIALDGAFELTRVKVADGQETK